MAMFDGAKPGDRVWGMRNGWGTVCGVHFVEGSAYQICVDFDRGGSTHWYTSDGYEYLGDLHPTLFWNEVKITPPSRPKQKVVRWVPIIDFDNGGPIEDRHSLGRITLSQSALYETEAEALAHSKSTIGAGRIEYYE